MIRSWIAAARAAVSSSSCGRVGLGVHAGSRGREAWNRYVSWVTTPMTSPSDASVIRRTSMPSISTAPESTSYSRGIRYVVVVLPEPDGPTSATSSPGCASKSTSSSANGGTISIGGHDRARRRPSPSTTRLERRRCRPRRAASRRLPRPRRGRSSARRRPPSPAREGTGLGRVAGTRRRATGRGRARSPGPAPTASGASTISGSISRYSKIRSNSASAPWISTWTLSSWPSGKNSRLWSVVNATMSPIVGRRRVALDREVPGQPVHERRRDAEDRADDHEEPAPDHRLADLERGQLGVQAAEPLDRRLACWPNVLDSSMPLTLRVSSVRARHLGQRLLGLGRHLPADLADPVGQVHEERRQPERQDGQAPVDEEHRDDRAEARRPGCW